MGYPGLGRYQLRHCCGRGLSTYKLLSISVLNIVLLVYSTVNLEVDQPTPGPSTRILQCAPTISQHTGEAGEMLVFIRKTLVILTDHSVAVGAAIIYAPAWEKN